MAAGDVTLTSGRARGRDTRSALTRKIFRTAFLLYLAAAVAITAAFVVEAYLSARDTLERELAIYQRTLEGALSAPLWSLDLEATESIARGMLEIPGITGVRIEDQNRVMDLVSVGDTATATTWLGQPVENGFPVFYRHDIGRDAVGYVTIYSAPLVLLERLQWRIGLLVATAVLKTVLLWIIFDRVSRSILVRPIAELTAAARRSSYDQLSRVEFDPATARAAEGTEIEVLRRTYNDMIVKLRNSRDALSALNNELESRVADRTRALEMRTAELSAAIGRADQARRQTAAALDAAERAGRAKTEFLALVSHEVRTPMNAILGFAEMVKARLVADGRDPILVEYTDSVLQSGQHLLSVINDILDLSKVEAGRMEIRREWLDPAAAARSIAELMREMAARKQIRIDCELGEDPGPLNADPRRFRQMLMNLVSNAVKFSDGPGVVRIGARVTDDGWVGFSVTDQGAGMHGHEIARALEPFGQVDSPLTRSQQGTGLGLPLVSRMIHLHDGRLAIDSRPGQGTSVTLWFPPAARQAPPSAMVRG